MAAGCQIANCGGVLLRHSLSFQPLLNVATQAAPVVVGGDRPARQSGVHLGRTTGATG